MLCYYMHFLWLAALLCTKKIRSGLRDTTLVILCFLCTVYHSHKPAADAVRAFIEELVVAKHSMKCL